MGESFITRKSGGGSALKLSDPVINVVSFPSEANGLSLTFNVQNTSNKIVDVVYKLNDNNTQVIPNIAVSATTSNINTGMLKSNTFYVLSVFIVDDNNNKDTSKTIFYEFTTPNVPVGEALFSSPGTYSWTAPTGVTKVSAVCIGGGGGGSATDEWQVNFSCGGGAGGGLGWRNDITVVPGQSYTVQVGAGGGAFFNSSGAAGGDSWFISSSNTRGAGGAGGRFQTATVSGGGFTGQGGGNGGNGQGSSGTTMTYGGGGGAGGYTGNGAAGGGPGRTGTATPSYPGGVQTGAGGGGGGAQTSNSGGRLTPNVSGGRGGGTRPYGRISQTMPSITFPPLGQSGPAGYQGSPANGTSVQSGERGAGGGGGGGFTWNSGGSAGIVRIIWGPGRAFPDTNADII